MNKKVLTIFALCCVSTLEGRNVKPKVIGGEATVPKEFPSVVGIWIGDEANGKRFHCGGVLVKNNAVLTSARCLENEEGYKYGQSLMQVYVGDYSLSDENGPDKRVINVKSVIRHERWNRTENGNDIAIVILEEILETSDAIKVISLPDIVNDATFSSGVVVGWGKSAKDYANFADTLKKAELKLTAEDKCTVKFGDSFRRGQYFCAGSDKAATCTGDEGSPLIVDVNGVKKAYGIVANTGNCETDLTGGLFTDVRTYVRWIQEKLNAEEEPNEREPAKPNEFPSIVGIWIGDGANGKKFHCGGALVQRNAVLTSARCLENEEGFKYGQSLIQVHAGTNHLTGNNADKKVVNVQSILRHEKWDRKINENDVAVIILGEILETNDAVKIISLPDTANDAPFTAGVVVGWGKSAKNDKNYSDVLTKTEVILTPEDECRKRFGANFTYGQFCAGSDKAATCTGDEGSPLIVDVNGVKKVYGIVANTGNCDVDITGGLLTDVRTYVPWIKQKLTDNKVIGRVPAAAKEFPSVVGIWVGDNANGKTFTCGGVLVRNNTVLTSAQCLENEEGYKYGLSLIEVHVGTNNLTGNNGDRKVIQVQRVLRHERWNGATNENDIALLVLLESLNETEAIKIISLPNTEDDSKIVSGVVVGWGKSAKEDNNFSDVLTKAKLTLSSQEQCSAKFKDSFKATQHFCAGSDIAATCTGDEGSPLIVDINGVKKAYGIVANTGNCETDVTGGLLTDLRRYVPWIKEKLDDDKEKPNDREPAKPKEFPSVVGIWIGDDANGKKFYCGGALVQRNAVLTSARCLENEEGFKYGQSLIQVHAGTNNLTGNNADKKVVNVQRVLRHENWNRDTNENDIAVIILTEILESSEAIKVISLPDTNDTPFNGGVVVGWGKAAKDEEGYSDVLKKADLKVTSEDQCAARFGPSFKRGQYFCAGSDNAATCTGDEGSPLIVNVNGVKKAYGIVSNTGNCNVDVTGGLLTDVRTYVPWIKQKLNDNKIVGRVPAAPKEYPSVVGIWIGDAANGKTFTCGGTLVKNNAVLTSARCLENEEGFKYSQSLMEVHVGTNSLTENNADKKVVHVQKVLRHENWNGSRNENDIALLILLESLDETEVIKVISLPETDDDSKIVSGVVVGWGKSAKEDNNIFSDVLTKAKLTLSSQEQCSAKFEDLFNAGQYFCAGSDIAATCTGDEGSPFIVDVEGVKKTYGVVSNTGNCESDIVGGLLTDVRKYVPWIKEKLGNDMPITGPTTVTTPTQPTTVNSTERTTPSITSTTSRGTVPTVTTTTEETATTTTTTEATTTVTTTEASETTTPVENTTASGALPIFNIFLLFLAIPLLFVR